MSLELQEVDLKRTRFYQDVFAQGHEEDREQGRDGGREQGLREGHRAQARGLVTPPLRRRFGPLVPGLAARLEALPSGPLEALTEDLPGMESLADLEAWLTARENTERAADRPRHPPRGTATWGKDAWGS